MSNAILKARCPPDAADVAAWNRAQTAALKGRCPTCHEEMTVIETNGQFFAVCSKNVSTDPSPTSRS